MVVLYVSATFTANPALTMKINGPWILLKTTNPAITSCFSRFIRYINFPFEL